MKVEHSAPGVFQLLPAFQEPDPHNKIVYSRSAEARPESDVILLIEAVAVFISSPLTSTCYFHLLSGPSMSVFLQYMTSTISQYKPRLWWYCHQFTTTLTTTLFIKQCAVNAECYHCTMKSSRLQPSESCNHRQFEYHPPGLQYIDGIVTYFGFQFTFHLGLWIMYWVTVLHIYNICMRMNRFNGTTIIQHWTLQTASIIMIFHLHPLHRMLDDDLQKLVKMVDIYLVV